MGAAELDGLGCEISSTWMEQMPMKVPVVLARELGSCYAVRDAQQRSTFAVLAMVSSSSSNCCEQQQQLPPQLCLPL
jgi:hypothetical protein